MPKIIWRNAVPSMVVAALVVIALVLVAVSRFRRGATVMGAALLLTAVLRWALPAEQMGPLAIRGKVFDVFFCSGLGGLMLWLVLIE